MASSPQPAGPGARRRPSHAVRRRRMLVVGGLLFAMLVTGWVVARSVFGNVSTGSGDAHGATILRYNLHSRFVHATLPQTAAIPRGGGTGRPLLVFLHGRGSNGNESNANGPFFAALRGLGAKAPDVIFPNGGDHSYWHKRRSGDWVAYVLKEVIPEAVRRLHADPSRVAIGGISMGGYGAFEIARHAPAKFCAVGGHSAALWMQSGDSADGAFDDAADYARHDVLAVARSHGRAPWGSARLWMDGGTSDPFRSSGEAFSHALKIPMHHWKGAHEGSYWQAHYKDYLRFYANALAHC